MEFKKLIPRQREFLEIYSDKIGQTHPVYTLIESRANPTCPKYEHDQVAFWGLVSELQRYRCTT